MIYLWGGRQACGVEYTKIIYSTVVRYHFVLNLCDTVKAYPVYVTLQGMGGREELFGMWVDYDFGKGKASPSCSTFRSPPLSPNAELEIAGLEVWGLGPEEVDSDEEVRLG